MIHGIKNIETKKLLRLGIIIRLGVCLAVLVAVLGLISAFGASIPAIITVYLGYRVIRLVLRLFGQMLAVVFTVVSILILIAAISIINI